MWSITSKSKAQAVRTLSTIIKESNDLIYYLTLLKSTHLKDSGKLLTTLCRIETLISNMKRG